MAAEIKAAQYTLAELVAVLDVAIARGAALGYSDEDYHKRYTELTGKNWHDEDDEESRLENGEISRFLGCQSDHEGACVAPLWECEACCKILCCAEGDDTDAVCDDCWDRMQREEGI